MTVTVTGITTAIRTRYWRPTRYRQRAGTDSGAPPDDDAGGASYFGTSYFTHQLFHVRASLILPGFRLPWWGLSLDECNSWCRIRH